LPAKKTDAIGAATELTKPKTDQQNITEKIATLKKEITDLTSISNIAITSAEGIGNAFAQSFQGLIDGSMTAKEALGSFFKSVADMFLEMAAQIIAKQITMIILQTILKALGAVAGGGGAMPDAAPQMTPDAIVTPTGFSGQFAGIAGNGATFANGIASFAKGGAFTNSIVSSPTMFKFADGGAMRTGLMGEAGPEAIMPLSRGADGSLGVQANGDLRSAMNGGSSGASGSPVLNMSFQSTSINGVEYVSRDQLESAMAETRRNATRDGAKRGMTMTLDRIQNSSSTRRKVGI
jgi:phage-related minor tail protein